MPLSVSVLPQLLRHGTVSRATACQIRSNILMRLRHHIRIPMSRGRINLIAVVLLCLPTPLYLSNAICDFLTDLTYSLAAGLRCAESPKCFSACALPSLHALTRLESQNFGYRLLLKILYHTCLPTTLLRYPPGIFQKPGSPQWCFPFPGSECEELNGAFFPKTRPLSLSCFGLSL
jgi:hypothetical protein